MNGILFVLFYPFFFMVVVAMLFYSVAARQEKRDQDKRNQIRQIRAGHTPKKEQPPLTAGFLVRRAIFQVLSGIVWLVLAIALSIVLLGLFNWRFYWGQLFGGQN